MIRTVVVAATEAARTSLAEIVRNDSRLTLVAQASGSELERIVATLAPDVVVIDRDDGRAAARVPTVALDADHGPRAMLARDASPEAIAAAIVAVAAGLVVVQPQALDMLPYAPGGHAARSEDAGDVNALTTREIEVLREVARGISNKAIAHGLHISEHTVKFHVASIFAKLGATSRTEAVAQGLRHGLIML
jgi:DNA-binding NarL/FixJ family response regulator